MYHSAPGKPDQSHYVHHVKVRRASRPASSADRTRLIRLCSSPYPQFNYNFGGATDHWDEACGTFYGPSYYNCSSRSPKEAGKQS